MASQPGKTLLNRVPEVTIFFWIIKVLATTVGETAADYLNEGMGLGLYRTAAVMTATLLVALLFQIMRSRYVAPIYWLVIVLISIAGTLVTDILTDSLSVPLVVSTTIFAVSLAVVFGCGEGLKVRSLSTPLLPCLGSFSIGWSSCSPLRSAPLLAIYSPNGLNLDTSVRRASLLWPLAWWLSLTHDLACGRPSPFGLSLS